MLARIRSSGRWMVAGMLACWPAIVLAQPADASPLKAEKPYVPWAIGVGLLAAILVVVFMNPRRTPQ